MTYQASFQSKKTGGLRKTEVALSSFPLNFFFLKNNCSQMELTVCLRNVLLEVNVSERRMSRYGVLSVLPL